MSWSPQSGRGKKRTVFDPGTSGGPPAAAPLPKLVGWLVTFSLDPSGTDFRLREGRNTIGADAGECDITIEGMPSISSKHAVVMVRDEKVLVRDNDSTNGTHVNGKDIFGAGPIELKDRDVLRFGEVECEVHLLELGQC